MQSTRLVLNKVATATGAVILAASGVVALPALAQTSLAMLDTLDRGSWELRFRDDKTTRRICVRSGRELIQIQHRESGCSRFVVEDGKSEVAVQYTCRGNGYGRTNIRKETGSLVQIDSQGIADGRPFQFSAEARRVAACN